MYSNLVAVVFLELRIFCQRVLLINYVCVCVCGVCCAGECVWVTGVVCLVWIVSLAHIMCMTVA